MIKDQKVVIIIQAPATIDMAGQKPAAAQQPKPASAPTGTAAPAPKPLPTKPEAPKTN
jgi:hypothetical protein